LYHVEFSKGMVFFNQANMEFEAKPRVHKRVWLMFQKSMGILVGGNHTSSRFCTR
jgi:hypothetical protein